MIGAIYRCCLLENLQPCNFKMLFIGRANKFISFQSRRLVRWFILRVVVKVEEIWIGDYLPTVCEVAQTIYHYAKGTKTQKRANVVSHYTSSLRNTWVQAFGEKYVISYKIIRSKVEAIMSDYDNRVFHSHKSTTLRARNRDCLRMFLPQNKRGHKCAPQKISSLFDIGKDTDSLTGVEKIIYEDQCSNRKHRISKEINLEYETEMQQQEAEQEQQRQREQEEMNYIYQQEQDEVLRGSTPRSQRGSVMSSYVAVTVDKESQC